MLIRSAVLAVVAFSGTALAADIPKDPKQLAEKLHKGNQHEIELGRLAQQKAASNSVKEFGRMMVEDHTRADQELMTLAKGQKWTLSEPKPKDEKGRVMQQAKQATKAKLQALEGPAFDQSYMAAMVEDHDHTIMKVSKGAQQFKGTPFGEQLATMLPKLQQHREQAYRVLGEVKANPNAAGVGGAGETGHTGSMDHGKKTETKKSGGY